jgi:two-component system, NarL family, response regulator DesR
MIRIVIAEDQEMLLGVIGSLLNLEEDMKVVGRARNGEEALTLVHRLNPDVCIMDIEMPKMSGLEAANALISLEGCKVILLTTFARTGNFASALKSGVSGYLLKDSPSMELIDCIRSIMDGKRIYSPELIEQDSTHNLRGIDGVELLADPRNKIGTIRSYFSTIIERVRGTGTLSP